MPADTSSGHHDDSPRYTRATAEGGVERERVVDIQYARGRKIYKSSEMMAVGGARTSPSGKKEERSVFFATFEED